MGPWYHPELLETMTSASAPHGLDNRGLTPDVGSMNRRPRTTVKLGLLALATATACAPEYPPPPSTRVATVVDTLHGVTVEDDYRWLEDQDAPETRAWIAAQNAYTEQVVGEGALRDAFRTRIRELVDRDDVGSTRGVGDHEYFSMRRAGEEVDRIYRRPAHEGEDAPDPTVEEEYEVFLDPAEFDPDFRVSVTLRDPSPDHRYLMYAVRQGGADEIEIRIRDLKRGDDLSDGLPAALYGGIEWDEDSGGYTYVHRDRDVGPRVRHHRLGSEPALDSLIWGDEYGPTAFISWRDTPDGRWRLYSAQHGWARNDWFLQDRAANGPVRPIIEGVPAHVSVRYHEGLLYVLTDLDASNYRLLTAAPTAPDRTQWTELIPETDAVLQGYDFIDGRIYVTYLDDVAERIEVFGMDGTPDGAVEAPALSSVSVSSGDDGTLEVSAQGYLRPSRTWTVDLASGERTLSDSSDVPFDTVGTVVTKTWYSAHNGVRAPIHVMHRSDVELDGTNPTILNGYGGFNAAITPGFSTTAAAWVEMGGVYAVATLPGGSEFGEDWHRAGMLQNKPNVFRDFIAAAEHLVAEGYTSPEHLGISGGSNGGLLVASAMTMRPDLFRAVLCTYPDLDMVRFFEFGQTNNKPALLEYGDARIPDHFEVMRSYSPYQNVEEGVDYPAVMLTTGDLDTRVPPLQARKMAARLQAATASGRPIVLWYDEMGGHAAGRGRPMSLRVEDAARELTFMARQLGLDLPDPSVERGP